jgi:hypothetical protein
MRPIEYIKFSNFYIYAGFYIYIGRKLYPPPREIDIFFPIAICFIMSFFDSYRARFAFIVRIILLFYLFSSYFLFRFFFLLFFFTFSPFFLLLLIFFLLDDIGEAFSIYRPLYLCSCVCGLTTLVLFGLNKYRYVVIFFFFFARRRM